MFTGMIEGLGKITAIKFASEGGKLSIVPIFNLNNLSVGNSIAVDGACLTVTKVQKGCFNADVSSETLKKTVLRQAKVGKLVNLERAIKFSDRLDGHLVSGHVDGVSSIKWKKTMGNATVISFSVPKSLSEYIITKGSIAIDGISLTINSCNETSFSVSVIPHTLKMTTLGAKKNGALVNIETDIIGKYIEQFVKKNQNSTSKNIVKQRGINMTFLAKNGFA